MLKKKMATKVHKEHKRRAGMNRDWEKKPEIEQKQTKGTKQGRLAAGIATGRCVEMRVN
jgi:hypothetical protein